MLWHLKNIGTKQLRCFARAMSVGVDGIFLQVGPYQHFLMSQHYSIIGPDWPLYSIRYAEFFCTKVVTAAAVGELVTIVEDEDEANAATAQHRELGTRWQTWQHDHSLGHSVQHQRRRLTSILA